MARVRKLTLKTERLAELGADDLRDVVGADASAAACATKVAAACKLSDQVISLCGCLTGYCSIDVC